MEDFSLYVHVPFCLSKCGYCDFLSYAGHGGAEFERFAGAVAAEIGAKAPTFAGRAVRTVFFGGGTPTVLPAKALCGILEEIFTRFNVCGGAEITTEANPETVDCAYLKELGAAGFNRISFGVQSFDDNLLKALGRAHDSAAAVNAVKAAGAAGFDNINIDMMFGLPAQTLGGFETDLRKASSLGAEHISCYSLTIAEGTPFYRDGIANSDEGLDRDMYHLARDFLAGCGYDMYEISNFSKGRECAHNKVYWRGGDYLGLSLGAHSFISGERFHNTEDLGGYLGGDFSAYERDKLCKRDLEAEFMILGLRMNRGVFRKDFEGRFGETADTVFGAVIDKHKSGGLLTETGGNIRLTGRGIDLSNVVFRDFI